MEERCERGGEWWWGGLDTEGGGTASDEGLAEATNGPKKGSLTCASVLRAARGRPPLLLLELLLLELLLLVAAGALLIMASQTRRMSSPNRCTPLSNIATSSTVHAAVTPSSGTAAVSRRPNAAAARAGS